MNKKTFWGLFLTGLILKLAVAPFAHSYFTDDLFIPFLDNSILGAGQNPWTLSPPQNFPYGAIIYGLLVWPKALVYMLFGDIALGTGPLGMFLFKLPILLVDSALFFMILKKFRSEPIRIIMFYWLNPIVFFVNYYLGHIDIISMAFITFACFALFDEKTVLSGILAGCAAASKFHTVLAFPLILLYIWRNDFRPSFYRKIIMWSSAAILVALFGLYWPYAAGRLGYVTFTSPEALRIFSYAIPLGNNSNLYFGFALVLVVLGRLLVTKKVTEQGLFFGLGILFSTLVMVTNPMPSWFLWMMPFAAVFAAEYRLIHWALPVGQMVIYFLHYLIIPRYLPDNPLLPGIVLTLLQSTVAAQLALMWFFLVKREFPLSGRLKPVIIGIAGDSGAGKNRLSDALSAIFDVRKASYVEGDDYHKWERGNENWQHLTHLSPRANFLDTLSNHTKSLSAGKSVLQPHYDHSTGRFTLPRLYRPSQTIIIQGLHTLFPKTMRDTMDLKVFIKPDPLVRLAWKIKRDVGERNYSIEKVVNSLKLREEDGRKFIEPQKKFADWIIEAVSNHPVSEKEVIEGTAVEVKIRHLLWNDAPVNNLLDALSEVKSLTVRLDAPEDDISRVVLEVSGAITAAEVAKVAHRIFPMLRSLTRASFAPTWLKDFDGVNQLIALSLMNASDHTGA
jgi:uridine kinase